ncbi:cytochrome P460 family protein [Lysobacter sp. K5869]|uniref:cytochrome P460 family protein n=1 Tax=Lysobacter sp. K5869 TaxID=2820808 RepID=UPI001C063957|nr:cytochrome P460 family protein [Lysobacter sp. K5869]QWP78837.1 cytochrome P460 family protein [Lysobacter sp. K5869]
MGRERDPRAGREARSGEPAVNRGAAATILLAAAVALTASIAFAADAPAPAQSSAPAVPYPDGYPHWTHLKSGLINPGHPAYPRFGGLHHVYANAAALEGNRNGRYADGSVLVYDLFETRDRGDGLVEQGPRRHIDVMVKDSRRFAATAGWGYAEFAAGQRNDRLKPAERDGCAACHASRAQHGHVFSEWQNRGESGAPDA